MKPGSDREPGAVHHLHVRHGGDRTHLPDPAAINQDRSLLAGTAAAIHNRSVGQENHGASSSALEEEILGRLHQDPVLVALTQEVGVIPNQGHRGLIAVGGSRA